MKFFSGLDLLARLAVFGDMKNDHLHKLVYDTKTT